MKGRVKKEFTCKNCNNVYESACMASKFCCNDCRKEFKVKDGKEIVKDYVICRICNRATANVTGVHLRNHPEWSAEKYRSEFRDSPIIALNVLEGIKIGSKKAGDLMKLESYKDNLRKKISGELNPMHKSKTSDLERKSISPFSPEFYLKKNSALSREDAEKMARSKMMEKKIVSWNNQEYWKAKGYTEEEAKDIVSKKQSTFSLEKCIEKYGEEEGRKKWMERQKKWAKNYKKLNYSKKSQDLFRSIYPEISKNYKEIYFATLNSSKAIKDEGKNNEYRLILDNKVIFPDFFVKDAKKIIEFDGVYWHDHKRRNKPENQKRENERDISILESGYSILRINELEWDNDHDSVIKKCIDFILESNIK
jgi:hypothetical protein